MAQKLTDSAQRRHGGCQSVAEKTKAPEASFEALEECVQEAEKLQARAEKQSQSLKRKNTALEAERELMEAKVSKAAGATKALTEAKRQRSVADDRWRVVLHCSMSQLCTLRHTS